MLKQAVEKTRNIMESRLQNGCSNRDVFVIFWGLGPKVPQGGPKDTFWDPRGSNLIQKGTLQHQICWEHVSQMCTTAQTGGENLRWGASWVPPWFLLLRLLFDSSSMTPPSWFLLYDFSWFLHDSSSQMFCFSSVWGLALGSYIYIYIYMYPPSDVGPHRCWGDTAMLTVGLLKVL